jgi:hypothetical protein
MSGGVSSFSREELDRYAKAPTFDKHPGEFGGETPQDSFVLSWMNERAQREGLELPDQLYVYSEFHRPGLALLYRCGDYLFRHPGTLEGEVQLWAWIRSLPRPEPR